MEKPAYYAVIPANVRYAEIPANAKLLYGEITALCSKEGYCWASNQYFADLYGVSTRVIRLWVKKLKDLGVIEYEIKGKNTRNIWLKSEYFGGQKPSEQGEEVGKKVPGGRKKFSGGVGKNFPRGVGKNFPHSITYNSNTMSITSNNTCEMKTFRDDEGSRDVINPLIDLFKEVNPSYQRLFANKSQRSAIERLLKIYTPEQLTKIISLLKETNKEEYCPVITTPIKLEEKMGQL